MSCSAVRPRLAALAGGDLRPAQARAVQAHADTCVGCAAHLASLRDALDMLAELPRVAAPESIAERIRQRLEVERRGPGLALLFRSRIASRPLILPSLLPAALTVLLVIGASVLGSRDPRATIAGDIRAVVDSETLPEPRQGTESNPLFPSSQVALPRERSGPGLPEQLLAGMGEGSLFLETVVARDGSVSTVTLLEGDAAEAQPLVEALRRARFVPVRVRGRAVAVSVYRLISRMEVRAVPRT